MDNKNFTINLFTDWLIANKGYPLKSILKDEIIKRNTENSKTTYQSDLVIIDTSTKKELAIIEFKNSIKLISDNEIDLMMMQLTANSFEELQYFIIVPFEHSFKIYNNNNNGKEILPVINDDFPSYQSLLSNEQASRKLKELKTSVEKNKKKEILKTTISATIVSLIVALLISNQFFQKEIFSTENSNTENSKLDQEIKIIKSKIAKFEIAKSKPSKNANIELFELNKRISEIENLINQNPKNLMENQDLNYKINFLSSNISKEKELYDFKLQSLEDKVDTYTTIIFTLIVTIIGSLTAFTISAFKK
ncbi:hypothetical protein ACNQGL_10590 [Flavobacterium sp. LB3P21]|uniref:hypothetical protein n=1 Tax=Flavobacterium sp. LB3P21 TaxID=3401719 RepID=UPI003AADE282